MVLPSNWIELTKHQSGGKILVNLDQVQTVEAIVHHSGSFTVLTLTRGVEGGNLAVQETIADIFSLAEQNLQAL